MKFQTVKGMRDFLPEEMKKRQFVLDIIRSVFERWGYEPMDTPAVESLGLLAAKGGGGDEIKKEIYCFKDQAKRELGLRFDLTVGTARALAINPSLPKPIKRYAIGKVWRYDNPQAGRYREFVQCDIDIFGSNKPEADAEIIACTCDVFNSLGFGSVKVRVNNRKIVQSLVEALGIKNYLDVFRSIDKLEKVGRKGVEKELSRKIKDKKKIKKILDFVEIRGDIKILKGLGKQLKGKTGLEELKALVEKIKAFGYAKNILIDMSLVRGLDYYTGPVFEIVIGSTGLSLAGGGRFDKMTKELGSAPLPATGIGLGFERIMDVMEKENMFNLSPNTKVFVVSVNEKLKNRAIEIAQRLRRENISTDLDLSGKNLTKQLNYANAKKIPFVIFVGEKEVKEKKFKLKDMVSGKEQMLRVEQIVKRMKLGEKNV